jgi:hypothetical protein
LINAARIAVCLCSLAWLLLWNSGVAAQDHALSIAGPEELVLSHDRMTCNSEQPGSADRTDMPVTAFRRKDGSVVMLAGNQNNFYLEGPSVEAARRTSCANLLAPNNNPDPTKFTARRWLFAIYAKTYDLVFGLVHNEYHGNEFMRDGCVKTSQRNFECWYASTTLVVSKDGGHTFQDPPSPDNVLAAPPFKFATNKKRVGTDSPKIVGNPADGMTYVMVNFRDRNRGMNARQCLLRGSGKSLDDWRAWDGHGFNQDMRSPYVVERGADCVGVIPYAVSSLKYVTAIKKFVAIGLRGPRLTYAFSDDLIHWSKPQTLMTVTRKQVRQSGDPLPRDYFSLLDPGSTSVNFDTLEGKPYLYFVQYTEDRRYRDLYRVPLVIK